jgi:tetratricopeptide (TPR) repeat protein
MRGFVCKALFDYGDFDAALAECTEAVKAAEAQGDDNAFVVGKIRMFWGATLREAGRFDEAKKQLAQAKDHADESELGDEIAQIELASGHAKDAVETLRKSLAAAVKDLPAVHSNVITAKLSLAEALFETNDIREARPLIDDALESSAKAELNPLVAADIQFAAARIRLKSNPKSKEEAVALAEKAKATYAAKAPHTKRYDVARAKIEMWLAAAK